MANEFTTDNFEDEVLKSDVPVLVDFWAEWCGPCRAIAPLIDKLAAKSDGTYKVGKVNIDHAQDLANRYGVSSIPTMLIFSKGEVVQTVLGARPDLESLLTRALKEAA